MGAMKIRNSQQTNKQTKTTYKSTKKLLEKHTSTRNWQGGHPSKKKTKEEKKHKYILLAST
jgi:hypothetical protein